MSDLVDFSDRTLVEKSQFSTYTWRLKTAEEAAEDGMVCEVCHVVVSSWFVTSNEPMGSQEHFCGNCACQFLGEDLGRYPRQ